MSTEKILILNAAIDFTGKNEFWGAIDAIDEQGIHGWIFSKNNFPTGRTIKVFCGDTVVAMGEQTIFRQDICSMANIKCHCGFVLSWIKGKPQFAESEMNLASNFIFFDGEQYFSIFSDKTITNSELMEFLPPEDEKIAKNEITIQYLKEKFGESIGIEEPSARTSEDVKLIAYYLPQFHPIPENDAWWGPGFTEWTNVAQAQSYFEGHYQPHIPSELGFYDLRLPEVREAQAKLARQYGIYGFCYYYYWFQGRRLLERPLQEVFESGKPDFPFCICWANETWSRRWDGSENDVLMQQVHNEQTDIDFIKDVIPLFKDERYIKVNGAPLLIIYRLSLLPDPKTTAERWRKICHEHGINTIHLCMVESFGLTDPYQYGFDCSVQFPPHGTCAPEMNDKIPDLSKDFTGSVFSYKEVVTNEISREQPLYKRFPGIMVSWDNTARKKLAGNIFIQKDISEYELWLRASMDKAKNLPKGERFVFINAWNEWAEGAHLEPDRKNGNDYLEATMRALTGQSDWKLILEYAESFDVLSNEQKKSLFSDLKYTLLRYEATLQYMNGIMGNYGLPKHWITMKEGIPNAIHGLPVHNTGIGHMDQFNHVINPTFLAHDKTQKAYVVGWAFAIKQTLEKDTPSYIVLMKDTNIVYYAFILEREHRDDVAKEYHKISSEWSDFSGFKQVIDVSKVEDGCYRVGMVTRYEKIIVLTDFEVEVEIG